MNKNEIWANQCLSSFLGFWRTGHTRHERRLSCSIFDLNTTGPAPPLPQGIQCDKARWFRQTLSRCLKLKDASEFFTRCAYVVTWGTTGHSSRTYWMSSKMSTSRISLPYITRSIKRQMRKRDNLLTKAISTSDTLTSVAWISLPKKQSGEIT